MAWQIRDLASSNHADVRLSRTADFDCSRSGSLRTVFGTRLRLLFAIGSSFQCRGEKCDPVPDLLTSRRLAGPMRRRCFWIARKPVTIAETGTANHRFFSPTGIEGIHNIRFFAVPTTLENAVFVPAWFWHFRY